MVSMSKPARDYPAALSLPPGPNLPQETSQPEPSTSRPAKSAWRLIREVLDNGGPGYLQFAITNVCNARCDFCGFAVDHLGASQRRSVSWPEAREAIEIASRNQIGYVLFVGGEPLVHPHLGAMVRHAAGLGIRPMICTNGSLWTDGRIRELADAGLSSVIMSVDTHDIERHEQHRGLPDVCRKIQRANRVFAGLGIQTTASVTVSRLIADYSQLPAFLSRLGFRSCTFSYPLTALGSSYLSFSGSPLVNYRTEELLDLFDQIRQLKQTGFPVVNPTASLAEMQRHLRGEKEHFGCLAGHKYFYLDWNLQLYRCHYWEAPICHIRDFDASKRIRDGCTRCMIDCYRDPSILQFIAVNASDAFHDLRSGRFASFTRRLLDRRNLTSLMAVWEHRRWIRRV